MKVKNLFNNLHWKRKYNALEIKYITEKMIKNY